MGVVGTNVGVSYVAPEGHGLSSGFDAPFTKNMYAMGQQSNMAAMLQKSKSKADFMNTVMNDIKNYKPEYDMRDDSEIAPMIESVIEKTGRLAMAGINPIMSQNPEAQALRKEKLDVFRYAQASKQRKEEIKSIRETLKSSDPDTYTMQSVLDAYEYMNMPIGEALKSKKVFNGLKYNKIFGPIGKFWSTTYSYAPDFKGTDAEIVALVTNVFENDQNKNVVDRYYSKYEMLSPNSASKEAIDNEAANMGLSVYQYLAFKDAKLYSPKTEALTYDKLLFNIIDRYYKDQDITSKGTDQTDPGHEMRFEKLRTITESMLMDSGNHLIQEGLEKGWWGEKIKGSNDADNLQAAISHITKKAEELAAEKSQAGGGGVTDSRRKELLMEESAAGFFKNLYSGNESAVRHALNAIVKNKEGGSGGYASSYTYDPKTNSVTFKWDKISEGLMGTVNKMDLGNEPIYINEENKSRWRRLLADYTKQTGDYYVDDLDIVKAAREDLNQKGF